MSKNDSRQQVDGTTIPPVSQPDDRGPIDRAEDELQYRLTSGVPDSSPIQLGLGEGTRQNNLTPHERLMTIDAWMTYLKNDYSIDKDLRYGDPYPERREEVRDRDGHACQLCGLDEVDHVAKTGDELHVHHITPPEVIGVESLQQSPYNLITACMGCHSKVEGLSRVETLRRCKNPDVLRSTPHE